MKKGEFIEFTGLIKASTIGAGGAYVEFPYAVEEVFGKKGRVKVYCLFEGVEYRGSLVKMGTPCHIIGMTKDIRMALGKSVGDKVTVKVREDAEERVLEVSGELARALAKKPALKKAFDALSYTRRKEAVVLVTSAKKEETRAARIRKIMDELAAK